MEKEESHESASTNQGQEAKLQGSYENLLTLLGPWDRKVVHLQNCGEPRGDLFRIRIAGNASNLNQQQTI